MTSENIFKGIPHAVFDAISNLEPVPYASDEICEYETVTFDGTENHIRIEKRA